MLATQQMHSQRSTCGIYNDVKSITGRERESILLHILLCKRVADN